MLPLNFDEKVEKMKNSIMYWKRRELTPIGRITVVKSILLPNITHLFMSLPNPSDYVINTIKNMLVDFVWQGPSKIKYSILIKQHEEGGLKMPDIYSYMKSLKISWLKRLSNSNNSNYAILVNEIINIEKLFNCGKLYASSLHKNIQNDFWKDVLKALTDFIDIVPINSLESFSELPLFYNHNFLVDGKPVFYRLWYEKGVRYVRDLLDCNGNFLRREHFENKCGFKVNFLNYESLLNAVRKYKMNLNTQNPMNLHRGLPSFPIMPCYIKPLLTSKQGISKQYSMFINNSEIPTSNIKWQNMFNTTLLEWKYLYSWVYIVTKDSYLQWFQTRIAHRLLATNSLLCKLKISNTDLCSFCKIEKETLTHLFWECPIVADFIVDIKNCFHRSDIAFEIDCKSFLLGKSDKKCEPFNLLCLEIKRYMYLCKRKGIIPSLTGLKGSLTLALSIVSKTNTWNAKMSYWSLVQYLV